MSYTERFSEGFNPLAKIDPDAYAAAVYDTGNVNVALYHRVVAVIFVGDIVATGTVDADLEQASDATAGTRKAITGKSITQLTQAGGDGNQIVVIELQTEELDVDNGFEFVNLEVTLGTAGADMSAVIFGFEPRFKPVSTANYTEIVG